MTIQNLEQELAEEQELLADYENQLATKTGEEKTKLERTIRRTRRAIDSLENEITELREAEANAKAEVINYLSPPAPIPDHAKAVMETMFADYDAVKVHRRFGKGLSGSLVYIVEPDEELPNVVKIDHHEKIAQEWKAINDHIANRMANVILGKGEPVQSSDGKYAGLRYPLAGHGVFDVDGLYNFLRQQDAAEGEKVLSRLFKSLGTLYNNTQRRSINLQVWYDTALPQNLIVDCVQETSYGRPFDLDDIRTITFRVGDPIQVSQEWVVTEYLRAKNGVELRHPSPHYGFRMQLINVKDWDDYEIGQPLNEALNGTVIATRASIFREALEQTVGSNVDANASTLPRFFDFPNPLYYLDRQLQDSLRVFTGPIHGDLNLENVLVDIDNHEAHFIDFAKARHDHVIRDFLHLEMNLATTLLTEAIMENGYDKAKVREFYERLHCAAAGEEVDPPAGLEKPFALIRFIRQEASNYLARHNEWAEYEQALFIYLLGSLRYAKVAKLPGYDTFGKQTAFYGAATVLNILRNGVECQSFENNDAPPAQQEKPANGQTQAKEIPPPPQPVTQMPISQMRKILADGFSEQELRDFIMDLGLDAESLGRYKSELARGLIDYHRRRNILPTLQEACYKARPNAPWWG